MMKMQIIKNNPKGTKNLIGHEFYYNFETEKILFAKRFVGRFQ